jgi:uridine kinase
MKIKINGETKEFNNPIRILDLVKEEVVYAAKVNNRLRELTYIIKSDSEIELLGLDNYDSMLIYENSLRFLICHAVHNLFKYVSIEFYQFISQSICFSL